jgi:hypothetical protein
MLDQRITLTGLGDHLAAHAETFHGIPLRNKLAVPNIKGRRGITLSLY